MKTRKVKSFKSDTVPHNKMVMRMVNVRSETANADTKSVEVIIATENPVERYDETRGEVYREILTMQGCEFRTALRQLPIVDSHDRSTVRNVLGSVRNLRFEGTQLVGEAVFARDSDSQDAFQKLVDGHLTDFSITATPREAVFIPAGEVVRTATGEITGPAELITKWIPTDASLVATGADESATVRNMRRSYFLPNSRGVIRMLPEELKAALVAKGMPEQIEEVEAALAWAMGLITQPPSAAAVPAESEAEPPAEIQSAADDSEDIKKADAPAEEPVKEEIAKSVDRALAADRKRRREIQALCQGANIEREFADKLCDAGCSINAARQQVLERMMSNNILGSSSGRDRIEVTRSGEDAFRAAMQDGLIQRAISGANIKRDVFNGNRPAAGAEDFRNQGLLRLAERWIQRAGVNTDRMSARDIASIALGSRSALERHPEIRREAMHTIGSFSSLMLNAANKTLLAAYEEAPFSFERWVRKAPSVPDFKTVNRVRFSEAPDIEVVPENQPYREQQMSDNRASYSVEKYGALFSVSWETVVNDDLDAISRIPAMHGNAARRKQNKVCYQVLFSNPTMQDTVALFGSHASGTNLSGASANPSVSTLNTAFAAMMIQKGLSTDVVLNIVPRYIIVPVALSAVTLQLMNSIADPGAGGSAAGNSNTLNIYGPQGLRPIEVIIDPVLDANSTTAWYLAADNSQVDTLEIAYLQGEETPVLESEWDFRTDTYLYKVRQTFGAAAIDWRGLYKYATS